MKTPKKKSLIRIIAASVLVIGGILYSLADRYLIEHVEIANASGYTSTTTEITTSQDSNTETAAGDEELTSSKDASQIGSITTEETTSEETTTDSTVSSASSSPVVNVSDGVWSYQSDNVTITITKEVTGSGNDTMTYYVADVIVSDATQLKSAFAKNEFGRNIIEYTSAIAEENNAIFAINGDYYGFRTDGIEIRNGVIYRDSPARTGLAFYLDGSMEIYDETQTTAQQLLDAGVWNTLSFGPALIQDGTMVTDFGTVSIDTNIGNHTIQGNNPRTGIGIIDNNHYVFVVVDGRSKGYSRGASLTEFAQIFADLGCTDAYNIDGGGSSTMVFMGDLVNNPLGKMKERGTSDILYIG